MAPTGGLPLKASAARANDCTIARVWTTSRSLRLSEGAATRPDQGPNTRVGAN